MRYLILSVFTTIGALCFTVTGHAQIKVDNINLSGNGSVESIYVQQKGIAVPKDVPFVSYQVNKIKFSSLTPSASIKIGYTKTISVDGELKLLLHFENISKDTLLLDNVFPFSMSSVSSVITGMGTHELSRTYLFLPHKLPVNVIVPDNAWDLGYASLVLNDSVSIAALTRRDRSSIRQGSGSRFETTLQPGGSVDYNYYVVFYKGDWHEGLRKVFQEKILFDKYPFDDSLFKREDLQWMRHTYILSIMDAWDKRYYDIADGKFHLKQFIEKGKRLFGGADVVSIWPTWPTLGLDQRNQFELYRDLPGGLPAIKKQAEACRSLGTKFFICYNPWDESTDQQDHFEGLSNLIRETTADGVVLDTKAEAGKKLQAAADKVRKGVIMYSEGMAVPKDMEGIVSGRVHNALYYPPMLNLNKFIKPEFTIYRVATIDREKIQREYAVSFFNGYGTEINIMGAGEPDWVDEQYKYLGRTTRILRENTDNFVTRGYTPLLPTTADSIWVNKWKYGEKTLYTIFSIIPQGYKGNLFAVTPDAHSHFIDLWHHRMVEPVLEGNQWMIPAETESFNAAYSGTNNEGNVDCIAQLPKIIGVKRNGDMLSITVNHNEGEIRIWAGSPDYAKKPAIFKATNRQLSLQKYFGSFEGDFVIQYLEAGILLDETIANIDFGEPRRVSKSEKTKLAASAPSGMVKIPAGAFQCKTTHGDEFIRYPKQDEGMTFELNAFWMDQFPVTNKEFESFLNASHYRPVDTANFLKHWTDGKIPIGEEKFPVTYVSYEDALAYAKWAGKRLPTEIEWQYAAQANDGREWPWDRNLTVKRSDEYVNSTLTVVHLEGIAPSFCNLGDGKLYPVGSYPKGANPFGLQDLVGSVWQLTNDMYMQSSHRFIILKGGSYFKPSGSWWYVQGGPRELHYRQYLLRVSQGFERNATVGFRCVKDAE